MPLRANGIEAWIQVDRHDATLFQPEAVEAPTGQTCWIASELNKGFSIHWKNTDVFCQTVARIWVDGIECSGEILRGPNFAASVSGRRTSSSTVSPFVFSPLQLTDDDAFLGSAADMDVGLIRLEIWTINMTGTEPYKNLAPAAETKVHERDKKAVAHHIKFGQPEVQAPRAAAIIEYLELIPLVTFTFKYRSIDILRAHDIAPKRVKRKEGGGSHDSKDPKRIKTEPGPSVVIDLTREETPTSSKPSTDSEIIDLT
ncbi:hypothetical protein C8R43DRAFT_1033875 [Mycena crocata]|nr:hypothetical protein C8R43DRAFT_1033875 [Mycena crocata]